LISFIFGNGSSEKNKGQVIGIEPFAGITGIHNEASLFSAEAGILGQHPLRLRTASDIFDNSEFV
jgi:hypothetical protein